MNWDTVISNLIVEIKQQQKDTKTKEGFEALIFAASVVALCAVVKALKSGRTNN